ncbi:DUF2493 domain-containing protein [Mesorhizobium amorphae]|uniref:DUF2493 domain-containing protein n=1 Tax=Mesorhizobium amorphae TaxID=71433 RepID=UPI0011849FB6|nr:DUF2493 domain-containing protein [Mesorhizobium amorphae]
MTRVLVCGGRTFGEVPRDTPVSERPRIVAVAREQARLIWDTLDAYRIDGKLTVLIHGACRTGADFHADRWARNCLVPVEPFPARWKVDGKLDRSAGPRRNQQMIDEGKPDLVIAFPGGDGTADMISRAVKAAVEIVRIEP